MKQGIEINEEETIDIFVPLEIKKRKGTAMIMHKNFSAENDQKYFDKKLLKSLARAYNWKIMLEEERVSCLAEIAKMEKTTSSFVSMIFDLNFLSPKVVDRILSGAQPRTLKLYDMITKEIPGLWQEQEEKWGF